MTKSQIEEERVRFEKYFEFELQFSSSGLEDIYLDATTGQRWRGWLAAKQDEANKLTEELK